MLEGQLQQAREQFEYVYKTAVDYDDALMFGAGAHYRLGMICIEEDKRDEALQHFKMCMHLSPDHQEARKQYWQLIPDTIPEAEPAVVS